MYSHLYRFARNMHQCQIRCHAWKIVFPIFFCTLLFSERLSGQQLFLLAGQSNAVGQGDSAKSMQPLPGTAFEFDAEAGSFIPLRDPVGKPWKLFQRAGTGSVAPAFARRYHELSGKKVYFVTAARGGSSCASKAELSTYDTWDESGQLFPQAIEKTRMAEKASGMKLSGIIWMQGERDANAFVSAQIVTGDYEDAFVRLIKRFRKEFGEALPVYIVQTGFQQDKSPEGCQMVRDVQQSVSRKMKHVYLAYTETDAFAKRGWFKDNVHYNQEALNDIGENTASFAFARTFRRR
jgi:hypothetical protein